MANAIAALALLIRDAGHFDLVFSDVVMPGMDGIAFGQEVRRRHPGLPVVVTSGSNALKAYEGQCGFEMVLKPYTSDTLMRAFHKAIAARR